MMTAEDVAKELGVSKGHVYKLIRELNGELKKAGYLVIAGKVPKAFWETKFYGYNQPNAITKTGKGRRSIKRSMVLPRKKKRWSGKENF